MVKRVLCCLMWLALLPLGAFASEEEALHTASFAIPSAWGAQYAQLPLDDRWFLRDPHQYHHGLARISLAMAVSAFRGNAGAPDQAIRTFLSQLAFGNGQASSHDIAAWDYEITRDDTAAAAIAWRPLAFTDTPAALIAVAVCGGNYGDEWKNNLDFGLAGDHAGFARAAARVTERLRQFEADRQLTDMPRVYWLSGFGRGGAICNVAAARLADGGREKVFCYTFAAPLTVLQPAESGGIFNLVAAADPLTMLPPAAWGFARNGRDLYLPTSLDRQHPYAGLLEGYSRVFSQFSGQNDSIGDTDLALMAREAVGRLTEEFGGRASYERNSQALLYGILTGGRLSAGDMLRAYALLQRVGSAARSAQRGPLPAVPPARGGLAAFSSPEISALWAQHDPAVYFSWILSLTDESVLLSVSPSQGN